MAAANQGRPAIRGESASRGLARQNTVSFDERTLVTSCLLQVEGRCDLARLADFCDPANWSTTCPRYWRTSAVVAPGPTPGTYVAAEPSPSGVTWRGILHEMVCIDLGGLPLSSVVNFLNVDFSATDTRIDLTYSLRHCAGGSFLGGVQGFRMDVDRGHVQARRIEGDRVRFEALKCVRFTDLAPRRTRGQGGPGAGQILNRNAPELLGAWMETLIDAGLAVWARE